MKNKLKELAYCLLGALIALVICFSVFMFVRWDFDFLIWEWTEAGRLMIVCIALAGMGLVFAYIHRHKEFGSGYICEYCSDPFDVDEDDEMF